MQSFQMLTWLLVIAWLSPETISQESPHREFKHSVHVYHFQIAHWGETLAGMHECGDIACEWTIGDQTKALRDNLYFANSTYQGLPTTTIALYNVHAWYEKHRIFHPAYCEIRTNFSLAESEESKIRYGWIFNEAFPNFDGYSSTSPAASIPRAYDAAFMKEAELQPLVPFHKLVKGGSYVASDCHRHDHANANRDHVVHMLRTQDVRIDGLGRCMHTRTGPEGIELPRTRDSRYNLQIKRQAIGKFMFNMAFENSLEPGYVTEKPFDALLAGTVPVYLGDAAHLRSLLPDPMAAIFVADFNDDYVKLAAYLKHLMENETAYELHRQWRQGYSLAKNLASKPPGHVMKNSWFCRICQWGAREVSAVPSISASTTTAGDTSALLKNVSAEFVPLANRSSLVHKQADGVMHVTAGRGAKRRTHVCNKEHSRDPVKAPADWEGRVIRGRGQRQIFLVKGGTLHGIPDLDTFMALGFDLEKDVLVVQDREVDALLIGDEVPRTH